MFSRLGGLRAFRALLQEELEMKISAEKAARFMAMPVRQAVAAMEREVA